MWAIAKLLLLLLFLSSEINGDGVKKEERPVLVVISYDAFRNEYFKRNITSTMNLLKEKGTSADYMRNVFPTKTFPNHHSIATGVFPEKHGVMANIVFDHKLGKLGYSYELFHHDEDIVPIWTLNELNGQHSGCIMWPGADFKYTHKNITCTHNIFFNLSISWETRVDKMMEWILDPVNPANLIMLYIEEPDLHGHAFGPESSMISEYVRRLDGLTKYIYDKINFNHLENRVNVVHLSDHGMDSLMPKNFINLTNFVPSNLTFNMYGTTPVLQIVPENMNDTEAIYKGLERGSMANGHFKVYLNDSVPGRWRYHNLKRTGPITALADLGYGFEDMWKSAAYYEKEYKIKITNDTKYGVHGYDNKYPIMNPIFFAYGPKIKENFKVEPFDTVDLYYLFCKVLDLSPPAYLSGKQEHILGILREEEKNDDDDNVSPSLMTIIFMVSVLSSFILVSVFALVTVWRRRRRENLVPHYLYDENETFGDHNNDQNTLIHAGKVAALSVNDPGVSIEIQ